MRIAPPLETNVLQYVRPAGTCAPAVAPVYSVDAALGSAAVAARHTPHECGAMGCDELHLPKAAPVRFLGVFGALPAHVR